MRAFAFIALLCGAPAFAHVLTIDSLGRNKWWPAATAEFFTNYSNTTGLSGPQVFTALTNSLSYWKYGGTASVSFDYWQGNGSTVSPVVSYDGRNAVFFYSQAQNVTLGSGVIGVTYVYSTGTSILETDIVFNDQDFVFSLDPANTTNLTGASTVYLEGVATHEFGHAYGLSHSSNQMSSMMWQEARGQSKPSCDDLTGLAALYPNGSYTAQAGAISGTIRNAAGTTGVFGAHVQAISRRRGTVLGAAVTGPSGAFTIPNLEPGAYTLMVEPFTNIVSALCGGSAVGCYYGATNASTTCGGSAFKRFFPESAAGYASVQTVTAGATVNAGSFNVTCAAMNQLHANTGALGTAPTVLNAVGSTATAVYGVFSGAAGADTHYYRITNVPNGAVVSAKTLSFSLYSRADVTVSLVDSLGVAMGASVADVFPAAPGAGKYVNHDSSASATTAAAGDVYVKVLYAANFSAGLNGEGYSNMGRYPGPAAVDSQPFYHLLLTINDATALVQVGGAAVLADNARCEKSYSFSAYPNRGSPPALSSNSSASSSSGASVGGAVKKITGGCGTIASSRGGRGSGDRGDGDGGGAAAAIGAFLSLWGALLALCLGRLAFRASRR